MLRHRHIKDSLDIYRRLVKTSSAAGVLFLVVPIGYVLLLVYVGIGSNADAVEIYVRNVSSIVAMVITGLFFDYFTKVHQSDQAAYFIMKPLRKITVFMGIASVIKVLISVYYLIHCIANANIILLFYVGEILVWSALAIFAFSYRRRLNIDDD